RLDSLEFIVITGIFAFCLFPFAFVFCLPPGVVMSTAVETAIAHAKNYIAGRWIESTGTRTIERRNPADHDDIVGAVTLASREDAKRAINAAQEAFLSWRRTPAPARGKLVARVAQIMTARIDELAAQLTREEGKTLAESKGEILRSINVLEFIAGEARTL